MRDTLSGIGFGLAGVTVVSGLIGAAVMGAQLGAGYGISLALASLASAYHFAALATLLADHGESPASSPRPPKKSYRPQVHLPDTIPVPGDGRIANGISID